MKNVLSSKNRIERAGPVPVYQQIVEWLRQKISSGEWSEHYKLKGELLLAEELGVNRGTLRKAIQMLIAEGLLVSVQGRGTFVAGKTLEEPLADSLIALSESLEKHGIQFDTLVIQKAIIQPPLHVASLLSLPPDSDVFYLERVRLVGQYPLVWLKNYVVYSHSPGIERTDFNKKRLFQTLEQDYHLTLAWGRRTFQSHSADDEIARNLEVEPCAPVMYMQQITYLPDDTPIELSDVWLRGDRFRLSAIVFRPEGQRKHERSSLHFPLEP